LIIMSATKILWGQIVVIVAIVLATMWAATQWVAWRLGFQPELGHPWFELPSGVPIYLPPSFFWWWYAYDACAPQVFVEGAYIASSGGFISIAVAVAMSVWRAREAKTAATYGSARWATLTEIRAAGLTAPDGVVLGRLARDYLRHDGPEHVLCFAPTRSGKGVGLVVPTLLTWPGSCIVHDIKGENWTLTSGFRAQHGRVLLFDPTNGTSAAYNPLLEVRRGEWEVRDVQNVADVLVDPEGSLERRNRDHDVFGFEFAAADADQVGSCENGASLDHLDITPGHRAGEIAGDALDHLLLAIDQRGPIEPRLADRDVMNGRTFDFIQCIAGRYQYLLGRAAAVQAGAAEQILLDHRDRHPGTADRTGHTDAGVAAAKDDHIEVLSAHRTNSSIGNDPDAIGLRR
jgi:hypothetical protein